MSENHQRSRSPELMSRHDSALLVVDVQEKLIRLIPQHARLIWNVGRLIDGASILGLPVLATEQYPQGLGPTTVEIGQRLASVTKGISTKTTFSCNGCPDLFQALQERGIHKVLVVGIEAHVCVQQTVFDLLHDGFRVYVAVDAVGSRFDVDFQTALRRMDSGGATLLTTESALFEWCEVSGTPEFKQISALVRQMPPATDAASM